MPQVGPEISQFSRHYFFPVAVAAMAFVSSYYWASFPFDNLCEDDEATAGDSLSGSFLVELKGSDYSNTTVVLNATDSVFMYCKQDLLRFYSGDWDRLPFNSQKQPEDRKWMTDDQETVTGVWGWVGVGFAIATIGIFVVALFKRCCCRQRYRPRGDDQGVNFSDDATISCYIPQVHSSAFAYPLIACSVDNIDKDLYDWADPERPYSYYDITRDAKFLLDGTDISERIVFSQFAHWPPKKNPLPVDNETVEI